MFILTDHSSPGLGLVSKECQGLLPFRNFIRCNNLPPTTTIHFKSFPGKKKAENKYRNKHFKKIHNLCSQ